MQKIQADLSESDLEDLMALDFNNFDESKYDTEEPSFQINMTLNS